MAGGLSQYQILNLSNLMNMFYFSSTDELATTLNNSTTYKNGGSTYDVNKLLTYGEVSNLGFNLYGSNLTYGGSTSSFIKATKALTSDSQSTTYADSDDSWVSLLYGKRIILKWYYTNEELSTNEGGTYSATTNTTSQNYLLARKGFGFASDSSFTRTPNSSYSRVRFNLLSSSKKSAIAFSDNVTTIGADNTTNWTNGTELALSYNSSQPYVMFTEAWLSDKITKIGCCAFRGQKYLTSVHASSTHNIATIGDFAFYDCSTLVSLFGQSKNVAYFTVGQNAFRNCTNLTDRTYIDYATGAIGNYAFAGCTNLCSTAGLYSAGVVKINSRITSLGLLCFQNCTSFREIYFNGTSLTTLGVAGALFGLFGTSTSQSHNLKKIEISGNSQMTIIGANAFLTGQNASIDATVTISYNTALTSINQNAFQNCAYGTTTNRTLDLRTNTNLTNIAQYAFSGHNFNIIYLPASITTLSGTNIFYPKYRPSSSNILKIYFDATSLPSGFTLGNLNLFGSVLKTNEYIQVYVHTSVKTNMESLLKSTSWTIYTW